MTAMPAAGVASLFTPFRLGAITLPNRFVMPAMQRGWCTDGAPQPVLADYYASRVRGGVGLIVTESLAVDHPAATENAFFARLTPATLPAWSDCIGKVKAAGGHILAQLWHAGALRKEEPGTQDGSGVQRTLSPSGLINPDTPNGRAATTREAEEIRDSFIATARLAQQAGADGVEVHGAHGYLLDQFLWPGTNLRTDAYGGDVVGRARIVTEIITGIRQACGPDFVIGVRFSQWKESDFEARVVNGPDELAKMLGLWREAGADVLHASTRRFWLPEWSESPLNLAGWARALGGMATITVGSVGLSGDVMESFTGAEVRSNVEAAVVDLARRLEAGEFDLVAVGRGLIGDPNWVNKVREGRYDAIRAFRREDLALPEPVD